MTKLNEMKVYPELTPRELALCYSLVAQSSRSSSNKYLSDTGLNYSKQTHVSSLFEPIADNSVNGCSYVLYKKLQQLFDDLAEKTKPEVKTIWYYIALNTSGNIVDIRVSKAFNSYEEAESSY